MITMKYARSLYWLLLATTVGFFVVLSFWYVPKLTVVVNGAVLRPFDLLLFGYTPQDAKLYLSALSPEQIEMYKDQMLAIDRIFPVLYASTWIIALSKVNKGVWGWVFSVAILAGAVFDYLENAAFTQMLITDPASLADSVVINASHWTVLKFISFSICIFGFLILLFLSLYDRFRRIPKSG